MDDEPVNVSDTELIVIAEVPDRIRQMTSGAVDRRLDTIRDWCRRGLLTSRKIGGRVYVDVASIEAHLKGNTE